MKVGHFSKSINREDLPSDFEIIHNYLGISKLPCLVNNPLRQDTNPSLSVFLNKNNNIGFKDFATGQYWSTIEFLQELWGVSRNKVYQKIYDNTASNTFTKTKVRKPKVSHLTNLLVKARDWEVHDLEYWGTYGLSKEQLTQFNVYPISHIILEYDTNKIISKAHKYSYCYVEFKDDKCSIKVYQPYASKENKFKNNHNSSVWDLWTAIPKTGEELIITSSRKDAMCLYTHLGIPSVSLQSETTMPKERVVKELKKRFKSIYILYDNDYTSPINPGQTYASRLVEQYGFINLCIPSEYEAKDPSDLYAKVGKAKFKQIIKGLIDQSKQTD